MDNLKIFLKNGKLSRDVIVFCVFFMIFMIVLIISGIYSIAQGASGFGTGLLIGGAGILFSVSYFLLKWLIYERANKKIIEELIEEASHKDTLTGLMSNTAFRKKLEHTLHDNDVSDDDRLLCVVIGIDRFKDINQSLGYKVGDMVLVEFAKRIRKILGVDDIISRLNGDEFAVVSVIKDEDINLKLNLLKNIQQYI